MKTIAVYVAMIAFSSPAAMQVPVSGDGVSFPAKDLTVNCYGAMGTATYDGKQGWDTGPMAIPGATAPGPYTVRVTITLKAKNDGPTGIFLYDTVVVRAKPGPVGPDWVLTWSGDGAFNDFPLLSAGASSVEFAYPIKGLSISW